MASPEPILEPSYWQRRLEQAQAAGQLHLSIFRCPLERWLRIEARHREVLARLIGPADSVLDAGCGYGRLLDLLPEGFGDNLHNSYLGVDLSPDLIEVALRTRGISRRRHFQVADLRQLPPESDRWRFDWAILISVRPMVRRNCGEEVWQQMESELKRVAKRLLFLEYDDMDEGEVIET